LAAILLIWVIGYLYWQIRIGREIRDLRRNASTLLTAKEPPSEVLRKSGSRAFPTLLRELDEAAHRGDIEAANLFYRVLVDVRICSLEKSWDSTFGWDTTPGTLSLEYLRRLSEYEEKRWRFFQERYPPWWMWWDGKRRPE